MPRPCYIGHTYIGLVPDTYSAKSVQITTYFYRAGDEAIAEKLVAMLNSRFGFNGSVGGEFIFKVIEEDSERILADENVSFWNQLETETISSDDRAFKEWGKACERWEPQLREPEQQPLTEVERDSLTAMHDLAAFDCESLQTTDAIERKVYGKQCTPGRLKRVMSELKRKGLVFTKPNRGGGCWLTESGRQRAKTVGK